MKVSRNDPCPCGSGKKYKACHMRADEAEAQLEQTLGPGAIALMRERTGDAARRAAYWEADVAPIMERFRETGERGAMVMVAADGLVLSAEVVGRRPVGARARARAVADAVMAASRSAGVLPERLHVRDAALAEALRAELGPRGVAPLVEPLPGLDEALSAVLESLDSSVAGGAASAPWTWAETEASPEQLAELHAAAAAYHRAAPWRLLSDDDALLLTFPGEDEPWAASVMGGGSIHYGLALYSDPGDVDAIVRGPGDPSDNWVRSLQGFTVSLSYDPPGDLPKPMRREAASAGWEIAAPGAYPVLLGVGVPGRRITAGLVARMAQACRAVVAFVATEDAGLPWRDPATGVEVDLMYDDIYDDGDEDEDDEMPAVTIVWPPLRVSHLVGPCGPAADLPALLVPTERVEEVRAAETARLAHFTAWVDAQRPSRASREREVRTAELWTEMLRGAGIPAHAVTEHDLRLFLYGWLVLEGSPTKPVARYLTRSLRRLFGYYARHEGFHYPWAEQVLAELDALVERAEPDDVRELLEAASHTLVADLVQRALIFEAHVPGTALGWSLPFYEQVMELRDELRRRWLVWHDEVVRAGTTDTEGVRELLVKRQREWENTPHPACGGRTPRQVVLDAHEGVRERLVKLGLPADHPDARLHLVHG